eukprot:222968-Prorocentrum_minimum.AAC.1
MCGRCDCDVLLQTGNNNDDISTPLVVAYTYMHQQLRMCCFINYTSSVIRSLRLWRSRPSRQSGTSNMPRSVAASTRSPSDRGVWACVWVSPSDHGAGGGHHHPP